MPKKSQRRDIIEEAKKIELIEGLPRVIEREYRRLLRLAEAEWERQFGGREAGDESVRVRLQPAKHVKKGGMARRGSHPKRVLPRKGKKRVRRIRAG